jgi:hypothetical protein
MRVIKHVTGDMDFIFNNIIVSMPSLILIKSALYWTISCYIFNLNKRLSPTYMTKWLQSGRNGCRFLAEAWIFLYINTLSRLVLECRQPPVWKIWRLKWLGVKLTSEHTSSVKVKNAWETIPPFHHTSSLCAAQLRTGTALVIQVRTYIHILTHILCLMHLNLGGSMYGNNEL